jgi:hypothetical protein
MAISYIWLLRFRFKHYTADSACAYGRRLFSLLRAEASKYVPWFIQPLHAAAAAPSSVCGSYCTIKIDGHWNNFDINTRAHLCRLPLSWLCLSAYVVSSSRGALRLWNLIYAYNFAVKCNETEFIDRSDLVFCSACCPFDGVAAGLVHMT